MTTPLEPRPIQVPAPAFDLWSLVAIYSAGFMLMVEAAHRMPAALLAEQGRYLRKVD